MTCTDTQIHFVKYHWWLILAFNPHATLERHPNANKLMDRLPVGVVSNLLTLFAHVTFFYDRNHQVWQPSRRRYETRRVLVP